MLNRIIQLKKGKNRIESLKEDLDKEKQIISGVSKTTLQMEYKVFFTDEELISNRMLSCIAFDSAISFSDETTLIKFIGKIVPERREELTIAFYGVSPTNRNRLLNIMSKRQSTILLEDMLFYEKGSKRTKGIESINKCCGIMLDTLKGKEAAEVFDIKDYAVSSGSDPMIQYEGYILDAPEREIKRFSNKVNLSDLSVASYYLSEKAKERLFSIIGEELAALINEDHSFMDNPSKSDVTSACENIIKEFDAYWSL